MYSGHFRPPNRLLAGIGPSHHAMLYHYPSAKQRRESLPVAIVLGALPDINYVAAANLPYGLDELSVAGGIRQRPVELVRCKTVPLEVPAEAEIVIEGRILKDVTHEEWMVEMLRTYDHKRKQPVFELDKISFRDNAIYHDILPGYAEHRLLMGIPIEAKIFDYVKNVVPSTQSVHLTDGGSNWLAAVIQIRKRLEGEPKNAILAAFAAHPSLKMATVVDSDINPADAKEVEYAIATRCQADKDLLIIPGVKGSSLDPSSDQTNLLTTKLGFDATATLLKPKERFEIAKIPGEDEIRLQNYF